MASKPISLTCIANENGRCVAEGHSNGRYVIDQADGLCKAGRRLRKEMCECPVCKSQFPARTGMVLASQREEDKPFSALNELIDQVGTMAVCPECAEFYIDDLGTDTFITPEALEESVKNFVKRFLRGAGVMHRHERVGDRMRNWCDTCGALVPIEDEENMGGVIRGNSVICLCLHCNGLAHQAMSDLPSITFFDGLESVSTFRRPQPKPTPTAKPAKSVRRPKTSTPADELDAIADLVDDSEEQVPAPEDDQPAPARKPAKKSFGSILDLYHHIMDGGFVDFSTKDEATGMTVCVVQANAPELCKCHNGQDHWARMPAVVRGGSALGFGQKCAAQLATHGVRLETTLKAEILKIKGQEDFSKSPRTNFTPKAQMEFVDPHPTRAPKKRKSGRATPSQVIREEARKAFEAKLADLDRQISTKRSALVKVGQQINNLRDGADDPELIELAREEIETLAIKSDDLLRQVQDLNAERESINSTGPRAFRQKPSARTASKAEGGKKNKKDKKKNGNSKAA